jgi:hypothetical protein
MPLEENQASQLNTERTRQQHQIVTSKEQPSRLEADISELEKALPHLHKPNHGMRVLRCVAAIVCTLLALEIMARFMVSVGGPYAGPTIDFDRSYALAIRPCPPARQLIVCIGGSFTKRSVYSELIEQRLRGCGIDAEIRNLATVACSAQEQLALLQAAAKHAKKPVLVISDLRPLAFESHYLTTTIGYEKLRFDESFIGRRTEYGARPDLLGKITDFAERNIYLMGYRSYLRYTLLNWMPLVFDSERTRLERLSKADRQIGQSEHGWGPVFEMLDPKHQVLGDKQFEETVQSVKDLIGPAPFTWTYDYSRPLTTYCHAEKIPLLYVWEPVHRSMQTAYSRAGAPLTKFQELFCSLPKKAPGTFYLDLHDSDLRDDHFKNIDHVNSQGAMAFSELLSTYLLKPPFSEILKSAPSSANQRAKADQ